MVSVLVAESSGVRRALLAEIIESEHRVVGRAETGVEAVELYQDADPDLAVVDYELSIVDGLEAVSELVALDHEAVVLVALWVGEDEALSESVAAGASGFVTKPYQRPVVLRAVAGAVG